MTIGVHSTATWHSRLGILSMAAGFAISFAATAQARQRTTSAAKRLSFRPARPDLPKIAPNFRSTTDLSENEFDCLAWQDLIYLMWPAQANQRGIPDPYRKLGASGPTVWESYRNADTVFLPEGRDRGSGNRRSLHGHSATIAGATGGERRGAQSDDERKSVAAGAQHHPAECSGISAGYPQGYLASRRPARSTTSTASRSITKWRWTSLNTTTSGTISSITPIGKPVLRTDQCDLAAGRHQGQPARRGGGQGSVESSDRRRAPFGALQHHPSLARGLQEHGC